jgi:hypothetical protein
MPTILQLAASKFSATFTLQFLDADVSQPRALTATRVTVQTLDVSGKPATTIFTGHTDKRGKVSIRLRLPRPVATQPPVPLPKLRISVEDLDGDEFHVSIVQPETGKEIPPIRVSDKPRRDKLDVPISDGKTILGAALSPGLAQRLKQRGVESLAALRGAMDLSLAPGLSAQDTEDLKKLAIHAHLQLVSRDHNINRNLIATGYNDVIAIGERSPGAFEASVKGLLSPDQAGRVYRGALRVIGLLENEAIDLSVARADGRPHAQIAAATSGETVSCPCECRSALSPLAYLADLLDYAVRHVKENGNEITLDRLGALLHQPFGDLPVDCSASETQVHQVRLCIEVLRRKAAASATSLTSQIKDHVARTYQALLTQLGTSYDELRLMRSAAAEPKDALAARLGVTAAQLNGLLLGALDETALAKVFGFPSTDPAAGAPSESDLLGWRRQGLRVQWKAQDAQRERPILDPDQVDFAWIRDAASSAVLALLESFRAELNAVFDAVKPEIASQTQLEDLLANKNLGSGGTQTWHSLGLDRTRFDAQWQLRQKGQAYDPDFLGGSGTGTITTAEIDRLLALRELFKTGQADDRDKEEAAHLLTGIEKRNHLNASWLARERAQGIALSPETFIDSESIARLLIERPPSSDALTVWREDGAYRRNWLSLLRARQQELETVAHVCAALVDTVAEAVLPTLRDACLAALGMDAATATHALLINASASGCHKTTRTAQAVEALQLLIWGLRAGQVENRALSLDAPDFDDQWKWLGSYASWRSAMFVFLYPEDFLRPELLPEPTRTLIYKVFAALMQQWPANPDLGRVPSDQSNLDEDEGLVQVYVDEIAYKLREHRGFTSESYLSENWLAWLLSYLRDWRKFDSGEIDLPTGEYTSRQAEMEDRLHIPVFIANEFLKSGNFIRALDWFQQVFDVTTLELKPGLSELLGSISAPQPMDTIVYHPDDPINPHSIADSRSGAYLRGLLIAIARCHLDFADSEFAKDTAESLARARELYLTAQRLLALDALGEPPLSCDERMRQLVIEIGEHRVRQIVSEILTELLGARWRSELTEKQWAELAQELRDIIKPRTPPLTESALRKALRRAIEKYVRRPSPPQSIKKKREQAKSDQRKSMMAALNREDMFRKAQSVSSPMSQPFFVRPGGGISGLPGDFAPTITIISRPPSFSFCIPSNPILFVLRLRAEIGLFKLNHCMNVAGFVRPMEPYAVPTDSSAGAMALLAAPGIPAPQSSVLPPTPYRYKALVERAKQLAAIAQQMEASYLAFLEKRDQEAYNLLIARQQLGIARATVRLQGLRVTEAEDGKGLSQLQVDRAAETWTHYDDLLNNPGIIDTVESGALLLQLGAAASQLYLAGVGLLAGFAAGGAFGAPTGAADPLVAASGGAAGLIMGAFATGGQGLSTLSGALSMYAGFERRKQEWQFQLTLAELDQQIAESNRALAEDRYQIALQEQRIAGMQADNASDAVNFLANKFTSAELYAWMSGIVGGVYRYFLQEAAAMAKLAQTQLAFERQEPVLGSIGDNYWSYTDSQVLPSVGAESPDRRGMTGSARLLQDIYELDQHAFVTERRKLQISRTLSLALLDPIAFAGFRASGRLRFATTLSMFDRDFPGHYLRLIKCVRVSVVALIPPSEGIKATLSTNGISRVVIADQGSGTFTEATIQRVPESVALSAPFNASGVFELAEQPEMLLPFEGHGIAADWILDLPRPANPFDYRTIADVLVSLDYTALNSPLYRSQVIQQLDRTASGERPFSFRQQFADAWYDLNNPQLQADPTKQMVVTFDTRREDFPPNVNDLQIQHVALFFARKEGFTSEIRVESFQFTPAQPAGTTPVGGGATTVDGVISTRRSNGSAWSGMQGGKRPVGIWLLKLPNDPTVKAWFKEALIEDILFVITFSGTTAPY